MNVAASLRIATPQTLREMALEQVREAIMAGRFPPGARLIERVLCQEMGVSRSVVREVLRHLDGVAPSRKTAPEVPRHRRLRGRRASR